MGQCMVNWDMYDLNAAYKYIILYDILDYIYKFDMIKIWLNLLMK